MRKPPKPSQEPWHIDLGFEHHELCDGDGNLVLSSHGKAWKHAERIMACINACHGITTEELLKMKQGALFGFIDDART